MERYSETKFSQNCSVGKYSCTHVELFECALDEYAHQEESTVRTYLVGHGLGALIAWYFVALYPTTVSGFVCLSTPHPEEFRLSVTKDWSRRKKNRSEKHPSISSMYVHSYRKYRHFLP